MSWEGAGLVLVLLSPPLDYTISALRRKVCQTPNSEQFFKGSGAARVHGAGPGGIAC